MDILYLQAEYLQCVLIKPYEEKRREYKITRYSENRNIFYFFKRSTFGKTRSRITNKDRRITINQSSIHLNATYLFPNKNQNSSVLK
jgi:hypothetical protein